MVNNCLKCNKEFIVKRCTTGYFCSRSCSASVTNTKYPKRTKLNGIYNCLECDSKLATNQAKYCSKFCAGKHKRDTLVEKWLSGQDSGSDKNGLLKTCFRNYLVAQADYKCTKCGWGEINPVVGKPILAVDHIDGNWKNNTYGNHVVLCYNCHTLTATFGALNKNGLFGDRVGTFRNMANSSIGQDTSFSN